MRALGYALKEEDFWADFEPRRTAEPRAGTLVVGDLSRIARRFSAASPQRWTALVRSAKPYFVAFLRTRRDERCAWLVDDLLRRSDLRFGVCRAAGRGDFRCCVAEPVLALEPDSIVDVRVPPEKDRLRVEFADGIAGEVAWNRLGVDAETGERLVLESADVGDRVRIARQAAGITQTALAERIGMDQAVISRVERGRHRPQFDTLLRVAEGLDLGVGELLAASG